ncbi:YwmB family TATA-box binding protein [Bacillus massiliglaciei]|uniref:YwmB family TATA-box binding protein n=1 Tax=Bacillus massiliglaciei TaxID=1816693 RepID=UPI000DA61AAE|nr:YwmB family TATA-box binding protein [Bacillus massiliglaciei]
MKNWIKMLSCVFAIGLIPALYGNSTIVANEKTDIEKIAEHLEAIKGLEIENWSIYMRERNDKIQTKENFQKELSVLKEKLPQFKWSRVEVDENGWKAAASHTNAKYGIAESFSMMTAQEGNGMVTYLIYEIKGKNWDKGARSFVSSSFHNSVNDTFRGNPTIFSCISGSFSDNMDSVLSAKMEQVLKRFNAREIESVQEENFISVTAHSELFEKTLTKEQLNLQVGLRTDGLGGRTSFVVGTPIVTFEY